MVEQQQPHHPSEEEEQGQKTQETIDEQHSIIRDQTLEVESSQTPAEQNPSSSPSSLDPQIQEWENKVRLWLSTMPKRRNVSMNEIEAWFVSSQVPVPEQLKSLPRPQLYQRVLAIHKLMRRPTQVKEGDLVEPSQAPFQRTDQWIPVYSWLESLDKSEVVKSKEISDWLSENPAVKERLYSRHSRNHLMHYVQKCHMRILRRLGKLPKVSRSAGEAKFKSQEFQPSPKKAAVNVLNNAKTPPSSTTISMKAVTKGLIQSSTTTQPQVNNVVATLALPCLHRETAPAKAVSNGLMQSAMTDTQPKALHNVVAALALPCDASSKLKGNEKTSIKQDDAFQKFELLTDLESQLRSLLSRRKS